MAPKKQNREYNDNEKRTRDTLSDDSLSSTPIFKQQKINSFVAGNSEKNSDNIQDNTNNDIEPEPSLQDVVREIRLLEEKFQKIIQVEISSIKENIIELNAEKNELKTEMSKMHTKTNELLSKINDIEQYTRRNNLRIFGVPDPGDWETAAESEEKVLSIFHQKLKMYNIKSEQIEACHRIGRYKEGKNRAVIVRFISRKTKDSIIKERKQLKGTRILIAEDLTRENAAWFFKVKMSVKDESSISSVWTHNGETFVYGPSGKVKISMNSDLNKLTELLGPNHKTSTNTRSSMRTNNNRGQHHHQQQH